MNLGKLRRGPNWGMGHRQGIPKYARLPPRVQAAVLFQWFGRQAGGGREAGMYGEGRQET